jgi:hypothetical protein
VRPATIEAMIPDSKDVDVEVTPDSACVGCEITEVTPEVTEARAPRSTDGGTETV